MTNDQTGRMFERAELLFDTGLYAHAEKELVGLLAVEPDNEDAVILLSFTYGNQQRYEKAKELAENAIRLSPTYYRAFQALSVAELGFDHYVEAEAAAREAIRLEPDFSQLHGLLSRALYWQLRFQEAEESAREGLSLDPDCVYCLRARADALLSLNKLDEAEEAIARGLELSPESTGLHIAFGRHALLSSNTAASIERCREALRLNPTCDSTHYALACSLYNDDQLEEAETHIREAIRINPSEPGNSDLLVSILQRSGQLEDAEAICRDTIEKHPLNHLSHRNLAEILYERNALDEAEVEIREAMRLRPSSFQALRVLVLIHARRGTIKKAITEIEKLMEESPTADGLALLAWAYIEIDEFKKAQETCRKGLALSPHHPDLMECEASASNQLGEYQHCLDLVDSILEKEPERMSSVHLRTIALLSLERLDEAEEYIDQSMAIGKEKEALLVNKGIVYARRKQDQEAMGYLQEALALCPNYELAARNIVDLVRMRDPLLTCFPVFRERLGNFIRENIFGSTPPVLKIFLAPVAIIVLLIWLPIDSLLRILSNLKIRSHPVAGKYIKFEDFKRPLWIIGIYVFTAVIATSDATLVVSIATGIIILSIMVIRKILGHKIGMSYLSLLILIYLLIQILVRTMH
ncbi:MAG: tetratricopeptide repeat protein [Candidatus Obscuribacterales bacterium]